jgi:Rrf2 family protein
LNTLLNISEASTIAIHSLALIGNAPERINVIQIAEMTRFSKHHIAKVLLLLTKRGYISSGRGPKGGYVLIKDPSEITLLEIYELIDGPVLNGHCTIHDSTCPFTECVWGNMREQVETDFLGYLKNRTIKSIINPKLSAST